jgi:3-oxoacyl-[acyl-carrier-protein] synthase III
MPAVVRALEYALPEMVLGNEELAALAPGWTAAKIEEKTGIVERRIAAPNEFASDLAERAGRKLLERIGQDPVGIDFLLYCTQSPDYLLPTTACLLQARLGLPTSAGALDFNLGCSGFVYGLSLAKGLIESGQAKRVLLLCADTYSRYLASGDISVRSLFGDGGAACLVERGPDDAPSMGPFVFGTDGTGAEQLIVRPGGFRGSSEAPPPGSPCLKMDGPEIFAFASRTVPKLVERLLAERGWSRDDVDLWIPHQASRFLLDHLRQKLKIPADKFIVDMRDCGNTVSCTIPIALERARLAGRVRPGSRVAILGFGVGLSWAGGLLTWSTP